MRLSDIVSAAGLHGWAEVALVICVVTFLALVVYLFASRRGRTLERDRYIPIEGDERSDRDPSDGDRP